MTKSEIHAVMTGGFATIAGSVLAAYIRLILILVKKNYSLKMIIILILVQKISLVDFCDFKLVGYYACDAGHLLVKNCL